MNLLPPPAMLAEATGKLNQVVSFCMNGFPVAFKWPTLSLVLNYLLLHRVALLPCPCSLHCSASFTYATCTIDLAKSCKLHVLGDSKAQQPDCIDQDPSSRHSCSHSNMHAYKLHPSFPLALALNHPPTHPPHPSTTTPPPLTQAILSQTTPTADWLAAIAAHAVFDPAGCRAARQVSGAHLQCIGQGPKCQD